MDSSTISNSLIGIDALLELLSVEEIAEELLYPRNTSGTTNKDDLIDLALIDISVLQHLLNRLDGSVERLSIEVLETSTGDVGGKVFTIEKRVDLNGGLCGIRKRTLGTLASSSETTQSTGVTRQVLLGLLLEFLLEMIE